MKCKMTARLCGIALRLSLASTAALTWIASQATGQQSPGASTEISGRELLAFAKSYVEFDKIRTVAELQLQVARTPQEKSRIEQLALAKFGAALEREGLTMARYGALYQKISANDRLREKVRKLIDEEQAKS